MRPIRYIGPNRNAGYGYRFVPRLRREVANYLGHSLHLHRLAYLVDFDRDRYLEEYPSEDVPR